MTLPGKAGRAFYSVRAEAVPDVMLRLLNFFAQRGLLPDRVRATRRGDTLEVFIEQPGIDDHAAAVIAEKMRNLVIVSSVGLALSAGDARCDRAA